MSDGPPFRHCGRDFAAAEIDWIRALIAQRPALRRAALSRALCERLGWRRPDGGLKDMGARVAMPRMHRDGLIALPPPRNGPRTMRPPPPSPATAPPTSPPPADLDEVRPVRVQPVADVAEGRRWNAFVAHHRHLGHTPLPGAQLRCFARADAGRPPRPVRLRRRRLEDRAPRPLRRLDPRTPPPQTCPSWSTAPAS